MIEPNIIGISGYKGSGKDTFARQLEQLGYERVAFADTLKDILSIIFGWERSLLEGDTNESREWREQPDEWWENKLDWDSNPILKSIFPRFTPRVAMQLIGTDLFRKHFNDSIWQLSVENKLRDKEKIVVTDCRFPNELAMIKNRGGILIRVRRGEEPEWFNVAKDAADGNINARDYLTSKNIHISEWAWTNCEFDHIIENNGTPDEMLLQYNKLK